jgi:aspartyl protease family protein
MRSVVIFAALALTAAFLVPRYATHVAAPSASSAAPAAPAAAALAARPVQPDGGSSDAYSRSVIVPRSGRGHFDVEGRVDGRRVAFMIDTGASVVALTERDAASLGIHPPPSAFVVEVKTANGTVRAAPTQLDLVEVGDLAVRDVTALVLPNEALSDNLLGLSFLSRLRRFEYNSGKLVLEQ